MLIFLMYAIFACITIPVFDLHAPKVSKTLCAIGVAGLKTEQKKTFSPKYRPLQKSNHSISFKTTTTKSKVILNKFFFSAASDFAIFHLACKKISDFIGCSLTTQFEKRGYIQVKVKNM